MQERNHTLIGTNGDRELWRSEIRQPDNQWTTIYRGIGFVYVQGVRKQTPEDHAWPGEAEAQAWLIQG